MSYRNNPTGSKPNKRESYQNLDEPSHEALQLPTDTGTRGPRTNSKVRIFARRRRDSIDAECQTIAQDKVTRAVDSSCGRVLQKIFVSLVFYLILSASVLITHTGLKSRKIWIPVLISMVLRYLIDMLITLSNAERRKEIRLARAIYPIFEFIVAYHVLANLHNNQLDTFLYFAVFYLCSYLGKAIYDWKNPTWEFNKTVKKSVFLIKILLFIQGLIMVFQVKYGIPVAPFAHPILKTLPVNLILLILVGNGFKFAHQLFLDYKSRPWHRNMKRFFLKFLGAGWIFTALAAFIVVRCLITFRSIMALLLLVMSAYSVKHEHYLFTLVSVIVTSGLGLIFVVIGRHGIAAIFKDLATRSKRKQYVIEANHPQYSRYVIKKSSQVFTPADDQEVSEARLRAEESGVEGGVGTKNECQCSHPREARAVYAGCGHGLYCLPCAIMFREESNKCPTCEEEIQAILVLDTKNNKGNIYDVIYEVNF